MSETAPPPPPSPPAEQPATRERVILERVISATQRNGGWVEVTLAWPDGDRTKAAVNAGSSREARARAATNALVKALDRTLGEKHAQVELDHVVIHRVGLRESVVIRAKLFENGTELDLTGAAYIRDDVATAAARAALQALNRKLG